MADKIFANGMFHKVIETKYGQLEKISFNVEEFVKFLNDNVNDKGYVNITKKKGKESGNVYFELDVYVSPNDPEVPF
jgi:hypothetical protein